MKFDFATLESEIEADWPVEISVPTDGGGVSKQTLTVRFRMISDDALSALGDGLKGAKASLRRVIVGFGHDEPTPFSAELLEKMLDRAYVRQALTMGYGQFALGIEAKNAETPPA
jgi:hypothetical protein